MHFITAPPRGGVTHFPVRAAWKRYSKDKLSRSSQIAAIHNFRSPGASMALARVRLVAPCKRRRGYASFDGLKWVNHNSGTDFRGKSTGKLNLACRRIIS